MTLIRPHQKGDRPPEDAAAHRPPSQDEGASSGLVGVLEAVWAEIRRRHPDVPAVIVTVGSGSFGARPGRLRLGHYAAARWRLAAPGVDAVAIAELFVGGEGLAHGPVDVLGTLLHEAAHGVAFTRGVKDTSRAGAYHNARFRELGEELGLSIERHPAIGWSLTTVPDVTAAAYEAEIDRLRVAIVHVRESEHRRERPTPGGGGQGGGSGGAGAVEDAAAAGSRSAPTYVCGCEPARRVRMAPGVYALAEVLCGACGQPFTAASCRAVAVIASRRGRGG